MPLTVVFSPVRLRGEIAEALVWIQVSWHRSAVLIEEERRAMAASLPNAR